MHTNIQSLLSNVEKLIHIVIKSSNFTNKYANHQQTLMLYRLLCFAFLFHFLIILNYLLRKSLVLGEKSCNSFSTTLVTEDYYIFIYKCILCILPSSFYSLIHSCCLPLPLVHHAYPNFPDRLDTKRWRLI